MWAHAVQESTVLEVKCDHFLSFLTVNQPMLSMFWMYLRHVNVNQSQGLFCFVSARISVIHRLYTCFDDVTSSLVHLTYLQSFPQSLGHVRRPLASDLLPRRRHISLWRGRNPAESQFVNDQTSDLFNKKRSFTCKNVMLRQPHKK